MRESLDIYRQIISFSSYSRKIQSKLLLIRVVYLILKKKQFFNINIFNIREKKERKRKNHFHHLRLLHYLSTKSGREKKNITEEEKKLRFKAYNRGKTRFCV